MSSMTVECPTCNTDVKWNQDNVFRPFCSERCQLVDLGEWASGNRSIPADAEHDDVTESDLNKDDYG